MAWAQWTIVILVFGGLLLSAYQHGKPKEGTHNFWVDFFALALVMIFYYFAGTFSHILR